MKLKILFFLQQQIDIDGLSSLIQDCNIETLRLCPLQKIMQKTESGLAEPSIDYSRVNKRYDYS